MAMERTSDKAYEALRAQRLEEEMVASAVAVKKPYLEDIYSRLDSLNINLSGTTNMLAQNMGRILGDEGMEASEEYPNREGGMINSIQSKIDELEFTLDALIYAVKRSNRL